MYTVNDNFSDFFSKNVLHPHRFVHQYDRRWLDDALDPMQPKSNADFPYFEQNSMLHRTHNHIVELKYAHLQVLEPHLNLLECWYILLADSP